MVYSPKLKKYNDANKGITIEDNSSQSSSRSGRRYTTFFERYNPHQYEISPLPPLDLKTGSLNSIAGQEFAAGTITKYKKKRSARSLDNKFEAVSKSLPSLRGIC